MLVTVGKCSLGCLCFSLMGVRFGLHQSSNWLDGELDIKLFHYILINLLCWMLILDCKLVKRVFADVLLDVCVSDKAKLKKENERLRSEITCHKCRQTRVQTLFLPCRHLVACEECANSMDDCITCSEKILGTVRTFLI